MPDTNESLISTITPEFIEEHNRKVLEFWTVQLPKIKAITDDQCREIFDLWADKLACNRLALEWRERLGMTFEDQYAVGIGIKIWREVLERLDEYDEDFRPRPSDLSGAGELMGEFDGATLHYSSGRHEYRVTLGDLSETFPAGYVPRFGIDVVDLQMAEEVLDRLIAIRDSMSS